MKKFIYLLTISFIACTSSGKYLITEGEVDIDYLFNSPNTAWFQKNYESYIIDDVTLNEDFSKLNEYNIEIFMNTRCHDREREVPRGSSPIFTTACAVPGPQRTPLAVAK